jgi:hypothetical protein
MQRQSVLLKSLLFLTARRQQSMVALDRQLPCLVGSGDCEAFQVPGESL